MKKKFIVMLIMIPVLILGIFGGSVLIVTEDEIIFPMDEFEVINTESPDLEQFIRWQSEIEIDGFNTLLSDEITCIIKAPDAASYIKNNTTLFVDMDYDTFCTHMMNAIISGDMSRMSTEIKIPVKRSGLELVAETDGCNEYIDAISGGLYSLYDELLNDVLSAGEEVQSNE